MNNFKKTAFIASICLLPSTHLLHSIEITTYPLVYLYHKNLEKRQDMPENEKDFIKLKDAAHKYGNILAKQGHSDPYELEEQVTSAGCKETFFDHNPIKRDLLIAGTALTLATVAGEKALDATAALATIYIAASPLIAYYNNIKERQNRPEDEAAFVERKNAATQYNDALRESGSQNLYHLEKQVIEHGWNQTWFDRNPLKRDILLYAGISTALGLTFGALVASGVIKLPEPIKQQVAAQLSNSLAYTTIPLQIPHASSC
jgi:hypothetical protein